MRKLLKSISDRLSKNAVEFWGCLTSTERVSLGFITFLLYLNPIWKNYKLLEKQSQMVSLLHYNQHWEKVSDLKLYNTTSAQALHKYNMKRNWITAWLSQNCTTQESWNAYSQKRWDGVLPLKPFFMYSEASALFLNTHLFPHHNQNGPFPMTFLSWLHLPSTHCEGEVEEASSLLPSALFFYQLFFQTNIALLKNSHHLPIPSFWELDPCFPFSLPLLLISVSRFPTPHQSL